MGEIMVQEAFIILFVIGIVLLLAYSMFNSTRNNPTWTGIIVSAVLGLLVPYLVLCFFGLMGEERYEDDL